MLYIVTGELTPEANNLYKGRMSAIGNIIGFLIGAIAVRIWKKQRRFKSLLCINSLFYWIGKIADFDYSKRLIYIELCMFAKQNAHVCVGSFSSANAQFSYYLRSKPCINSASVASSDFVISTSSSNSLSGNFSLMAS